MSFRVRVRAICVDGLHRPGHHAPDGRYGSQGRACALRSADVLGLSLTKSLHLKRLPRALSYNLSYKGKEL